MTPQLNKNPTVYLDMDGVLADFNTAARNILGATPREERAAEQAGRWPQEKWRTLAHVDHLYRELPPMPQAEDLVRTAMQFKDSLGWDVKVLTAIPKGNDMFECFHDKVDWMAQYFPGIRVHFGPYSHDKHLHCVPGDILVDDRATNCEEWTKAGGLAVRVTQDYELALRDLDNLFQEALTLRLV